MTEFKYQYEIIKKIISENIRPKKSKLSLQTIADFLDVGIGKVRAWENGQRPSADDMELIGHKLGLSAEWLLYGRGTPTPETKSGRFIKEYSQIGDTLNEIINLFPESPTKVAYVGGIGLDELEDCLRSWALPSCLTLSKWIHAYRLNANFLLAQIGQPFLTEEEYAESGPLDDIRRNRGDFNEERSNAELTPFERDLLALEQVLRRANATDEEIRRNVAELLRRSPNRPGSAQYPNSGELAVSEGPPAVHEDKDEFRSED